MREVATQKMDLRGGEAAFSAAGIASLLARVRRGVRVVRDERGRHGVAPLEGAGDEPAFAGGAPETIATLAPLYPEWLGDRSFGEVHGLRFPYVAGSMANAIASP